MKVSLIGGGNSAYALAFHMLQMGHDVLLQVPEVYRHEIQAIIDTGCIESVQQHNGVMSKLHGVQEVCKITTDFKEAAEFSDILFITVPAFKSKTIYEGLLPHLANYHIIVNLPGNYVFLEVIKLVKENTSLDVTKDLPFTLVEASSIPYACRKIGGNRVFISSIKTGMFFGVYPSKKTHEVLELIAPLFTLNIHPTSNVIEAGMCSTNFILHPPIFILNAGRIESGEFEFYKDGATPGVLKVFNQLDRERIEVGKALGFNLDNIIDVLKLIYCKQDEENLSGYIRNASYYKGIKAPRDLNSRFIKEDMNCIYQLVFQYFAKKYNIKTPVADALLTTAKFLTGLSLDGFINFEEFPRSFNEL